MENGEKIDKKIGEKIGGDGGDLLGDGVKIGGKRCDLRVCARNACAIRNAKNNIFICAMRI